VDSPYTSQVLHHFVGRHDPFDDERNWSTLSKILHSKCVSHPPHEAGSGTIGFSVDVEKSLEDESLLVPFVTCYADIPEASLGIHLKKYGRFGVSFKREFLIKEGCRPVTYVPIARKDWPWGSVNNGRPLLRDIDAVFKGLDAECDRLSDTTPGPVKRSIGTIPKTQTELMQALRSVLGLHVLAFIKPFDADLQSDHQSSFYMEREWRLLGNLEFDAEDVQTMWVAKGFAEKAISAFPALSEKVREH